MRLSIPKRPVLFAVLLSLLLLPLLGSQVEAQETQTDAEEARRVAGAVPEVEELLSKPTVEASAYYIPEEDFWRVVLTEEASGTQIATVTVTDDSGEIEETDIRPAADTVDYPETTEYEAIKLAAADPEVR